MRQPIRSPPQSGWRSQTQGHWPAHARAGLSSREPLSSGRLAEQTVLSQRGQRPRIYSACRSSSQTVRFEARDSGLRLQLVPVFRHVVCAPSLEAATSATPVNIHRSKGREPSPQGIPFPAAAAFRAKAERCLPLVPQQENQWQAGDPRTTALVGQATFCERQSSRREPHLSVLLSPEWTQSPHRRCCSQAHPQRPTKAHRRPRPRGGERRRHRSDPWQNYRPFEGMSLQGSRRAGRIETSKRNGSQQLIRPNRRSPIERWLWSASDSGITHPATPAGEHTRRTRLPSDRLIKQPGAPCLRACAERRCARLRVGPIQPDRLPRAKIPK
jgi:hypothetical protein